MTGDRTAIGTSEGGVPAQGPGVAFLFLEWPRAEFAEWGGGKHRVAIGNNVVDDLVDGIDRWLSGPVPVNGVPLAIGAVYRLTSSAVVDALLRVQSSCIVLPKYPTIDAETLRLAENAPGTHTSLLPGLYGYRRASEDIGYEPDYAEGELKSVRVVLRREPSGNRTHAIHRPAVALQRTVGWRAIRVPPRRSRRAKGYVGLATSARIGTFPGGL